jgi:hypothetical protein
VDGNSLRNPERIGFGGFLRNFEGRWLMSFTAYGGFGSNLFLELLAIKYGLLVV